MRPVPGQSSANRHDPGQSSTLGPDPGQSSTTRPDPGQSSTMRPDTGQSTTMGPEPSAPNQREREAMLFRKELEKRMCNENHIETLEDFMLTSNPPRFAWLDFLLSCPSKYKSQTDSLQVAFGSSVVSRLIKYYPDVIYRELFWDWFKAGRPMWGQDARDQFGALHAAVLCGQPEIVNLFTHHRKLAREGICRRLNEYLHEPNDDSFFWHEKGIDEYCFACIARAIMFISLRDGDSYEGNVSFLREFSRSLTLRVPEGRENESMNWDLLAEVISSWASAFGYSVDEKQHFTAPDMTQRDCSLQCCAVQVVIQIIDKLLNESFDGSVVYDLCSLSNLTYTVSDSPISVKNGLNGRWTPVLLAAAVGNHDVLAALIELYKSVLDALPKEWKIKQGGDSSESMLLGLFIGRSFLDAFEMSPLHHAASGNHPLVVKAILEWKFLHQLFNKHDSFKRTALQIACSKNDRVSVVDELLKSPHIFANSTDCHGFTPFHWSVHTGATDVVRFLVSNNVEGKRIHVTVKCFFKKDPYRVAEDLENLPEKKKEIQALLLKEVEIKDWMDRLYRDRQLYVDAANAILVGAALIASVTFGGWLQPPFDNSGVLHTQTVVRVNIFWAFNSLSFFFAIATVMAGAAAVIPIADVFIEKAVDKIRKWLVVTGMLFILSISCVLGAFAAAGFATLSQDNVPHLVVNMISTTSVGSTVCGIVWIISCWRLFKIRPQIPRTTLWMALQWPKNAAHISGAFDFIGKMLLDVCCSPCGRSNGTRKSVTQDSTGSPDNPGGRCTAKLTELLRPKTGVCGVRQHYLDLERLSTVKLPAFFTEGPLPLRQDGSWWLELSKQPSIFQFFLDEREEATLNYVANIDLEDFGIEMDAGGGGLRKKQLQSNLKEVGRQEVAAVVQDVSSQSLPPSAFNALPHKANPPSGVTQLNDSVWEFYRPNGNINVDIIFFHGLQDPRLDDYENAFWKTWLAKDDKNVIWPKDWLSQRLPEARILSVSYHSSATESDTYLLAENLVADLIDTRINVGQTCPVILVGHCLGGIVIKKLILSALRTKTLIKPNENKHKRISNFLDNFRGAFFYATPHEDSEGIRKFASGLTHPSEILHLLKTVEEETLRISLEFRQHRRNLRVRTYNVAEVLPTTFMGFHEVVVLEASARYDVDDLYTHSSADHFTVCQARNKKDSAVIGKLTQFISDNSYPVSS